MPLVRVSNGGSFPKVIGIVRGANMCIWVDGEVPDNPTNGTSTCAGYSMTRNSGNGHISVNIPVTSELEIHTSNGTTETGVTYMTVQANVTTDIGYADQSNRRWFYIYD